MTLTARHTRVDHNSVSDLPLRYLTAHFDDLPGGVAAHYVSVAVKLPTRAAHPCPGVNVQPVQRSGTHPHLHVIGADRRFRLVSVLQDFGPPVLGNIDSFHQLLHIIKFVQIVEISRPASSRSG